MDLNIKIFDNNYDIMIIMIMIFLIIIIFS